MAETKFTTGKVRFSYAHLAEPYANNDGEPKYSVTLLIPKTDKNTVAKFKAAMAAAREVFVEKNPGKKLPANLKNTLHDGDGVRESGEDFGPECKGHYVVTVSSKKAPFYYQMEGGRAVIMPDDRVESEIYSGCYGRAVLNAYVYSVSGNVGISFGLNAVMKLEDGERLGGVSVSASDFDDDFDDYDTGFYDNDDLLG